MFSIVQIFTILFLFSAPAFGYVDLSGLYETRTKPTVNKIQKEFENFEKIITNLKLNAKQEAAFNKLKESILVKVTPATLKTQPSRGPAWRKAAIDYLEHPDRDDDIYEASTYVDEDGEASIDCNYDDEGLTEIGDYYFKWTSVKPIKGSQKTIAYIVTVMVPVVGNDAETGESRKCEATLMDFAFEAKTKNGKPVRIPFVW